MNHTASVTIDQAWKQFADRNGVKRKFVLFRYIRIVAAAILACVIISTWYFMGKEREEWIVVTTTSEQMKNVFLPDSSIAVMAGKSSIKYDLIAFKKGNRDVEMEGKVFFRVRRNEDSPFSVSATNTVVTVLGTSFQVNERDGETELYVNSGKVAFSAKGSGKELVLTAGMSAVYGNESDSPVEHPEENPNVLSWQTGEMSFNNTSLENVIRDLSDYYQIRIVNRIESGDKHLTAAFNNRPLDEVLLVINQTLDVHLTVASGK